MSTLTTPEQFAAPSRIIRPKSFMLALAAVVLLFILLVWATLATSTLPFGLGMNVSRPFRADELLLRVSITNTFSLPLRLAGRARLICEDEGGNGMRIEYFRLAGCESGIAFRPGDTDSVLLRASGSVRRVRIAFDYTYPSDPLRQAFGRTLARTGFRPALGGACWRWMNRHGLLGGRFLRSYDRTWTVPSSSYVPV